MYFVSQKANLSWKFRDKPNSVWNVSLKHCKDLIEYSFLNYSEKREKRERGRNIEKRDFNILTILFADKSMFDRARINGYIMSDNELRLYLRPIKSPAPLSFLRFFIGSLLTLLGNYFLSVRCALLLFVPCRN